jgi:DHA1 family multidrug resistance protein-like MFS transporter
VGNNSLKKGSLTFLFVVSFTCSMMVGAVTVTVPIYAASLKASPLLVGLIGSAGGLVHSFLPFVSGTLCDRMRKRIFVFAALTLYGCSCLLYNFTEEASMLVFVKVLEWSSIAIFWPAVEALLADSGELGLEETLRRFNLSWGSAMVIGPVVGGSLITVWSIKAPFIFSMFLSTILGVSSLIILKEPEKRPEPKIHVETKQKTVKDKHYPLVSGLASIFLFSSVEGIAFTFFPAFASELGISALNIGWILFAFGAARVVTFSQSNRLESRVGRTGLFLLGSMFLGVASLLMVFSNTFPLYVFCFTLFGVGSGLAYAASIALILGRWETSRGRASGIFESLIGFGYFVAPLIGGFVSEYSAVAPYLFGFALSLAVIFVQLRFRKPSSSDGKL